MAGVNVKMGVTGVSDFKRSMGDAQAAVKSLNEALKLNESQLKLNGNQELYFKNKVTLMKDAIAAQTEVVKNAEAALRAMREKGIEPSSKEFQTMQANVYKASTKLTDMRTALQEVESGAEGAETGLNGTNEAINGIDRNKAWSNVAEGLGKVTDALERGARAAVSFGKKILSNVKDATGWADDLKTLSDQTGINVEDLQKMDKVAELIDTDVDAIIAAKKRMSKAAAGEGRETIAELFGINVTGQESPDDLFWNIGEALIGMGDAFDKESAAQKVFGRNWNELLPLFKMGREEYERMLSEQSYLTEDQVEKLGKADDAIKTMEQQIADLKRQFWADNADTITSLLQWLVDNKDKVVAALTVIGSGFGLLKLAEVAANLGTIISGFKELKLLGGGGKDVADTVAGTGGQLNVQNWLTKAKDSVIPYASAFGIPAFMAASFGWAANRRLNHRDQVRGTDEYLAAQSNGAEALLADYIRAQQTFSQMDFNEAADVFEAAANKVMETYDRLMEAEGGSEALQAYSDWRQERSLGNMDWEMPENLERMAAVAEQTSANEIQSNSEVVATLSSLQGLPAQVAAAVQAGMSSVTIVISEGAVGEIGRRGGRSMWNNVVSALN